MALELQTESPHPVLNGQPHLHAHAPQWHATAPATVTRAADWSEGTGWELWARHLARRKSPKSLERLLRGSARPLTAGTSTLPDSVQRGGELTRRLIDLQQLLESGTRKQVISATEEWLATSLQPATPELALVKLTWAYQLPELAKRLPPRLWWAALERLRRAATDSSLVVPDEDPLSWQVLTGELPVALAYLFPELTTCRELATAGCRVLATGWDQLLDTTGLPHAEDEAFARCWLACWARSVAAVERFDTPADWVLPTERFATALLHFARWARRDGSALLTGSETADDDFWPWLQTAADVLADRPTRKLLKAVAPTKKTAPAVPKKASEPAEHTETSESALLHTAWQDSTRLGVRYSGRKLQAELCVGKRTILAGRWDPEVWFDGHLLEQTGDWEQVCWNVDEHGVYLELAATFTHGVTVERQWFLARDDGFLLAADAVTSETPAKIEYRTVLPVTAGLEFRPALQTREGELWDRRTRCRLVPLGLAEWVLDRRPGAFTALAGGVELCQSAEATRSLFVPVLFDLDERHFRQPLTWRQLTVCEERVVQPADVAVGYRAQIGTEQWLVYRSLRPGMSRTLLGKHLLSQFLVGRLNSEGLIDALVEIE